MKYALISEEQIAQIKLAMDFRLIGDNSKARLILQSLKPSNAVAHIAEGTYNTPNYIARLAHPLPPVGTKLYALDEVTE